MLAPAASVLLLLLLLAVAGEVVVKPDQSKVQYKRKPRITSFTYENCGDLNDPGRLQTIQLRHVEDGDILVTAVATTSVKLEPPISTDIELFKRFMGMWIKLPCINKMVGSCKHQDLCAFGLDECPFKPLRDNNIPCQCPIAEGQYGIRLAEFPVPKTRFVGTLAGSYKGKVAIYLNNGQRLACYNGTVTVA